MVSKQHTESFSAEESAWQDFRTLGQHQGKSLGRPIQMRSDSLTELPSTVRLEHPKLRRHLDVVEPFCHQKFEVRPDKGHDYH